MDYIDVYCRNQNQDQTSRPPTSTLPPQLTEEDIQYSFLWTEDERVEFEKKVCTYENSRVPPRERYKRCGDIVLPSPYDTPTIKHQKSRKKRLAEFLRIKNRF